MDENILLGMDLARGESTTVLSVFDGQTEEFTPIHVSQDAVFTLGELRDYTERLRSYGVNTEWLQWSCTVTLTHKQMRQFKRQCKESRYKKPRIPRKQKKWFTTVARICAEYMADALHYAFSD